MTCCSYNITKYIKMMSFYNFKLQIFQNYDVIEQFDKRYCSKNYWKQLTLCTFLLLSDSIIINIIFNIIEKKITFKCDIYLAIFIIISVDFTFIVVKTLISPSKRTFAAIWKIIDTYIKNITLL